MSLLLTNLDGRVTLKGLLGTGGMGEVHRAWDAGLERPVAVKFVRSGDPKEADRLLLEARLQARVEHPNVVRVHDTGTLEGRPCIVMQLVEGRTFADLGSEADWRTKVALGIQAARGLGAAHRQGLVHRDVKPANILVEATPEGLKALLSDFGLARDEEGGLTRSGLMMGTVDYMAPEQVTGAAPVDFRADIYGLGATLYAVLADRPPFRNTPGITAKARRTEDPRGLDLESDDHPGDMLRRVLEQDPPGLHSEVPGLPHDLAVVVAKAMEKEPPRRYVTAGALADDLERVLAGEPILARPAGWVEQGARWMRRNPVAARALGVGLVATLAAVGFGAWNSRRATLAALGAAQMGAEAKAFELRLRMAHLAPAHDLRPVHAELRAGLARLEGHHGAAGGSVAYARGRVLLLLDELEGAQQALELAKRLGYRGAELEEALGMVYGRRYVRALPKVEALKDEGLRKERQEALDRELKAPAQAHLLAAGNTLHQQAFVALVEHRFEDARTLAARSRAGDPERMESTLIEGQAWHQEASLALKAADHGRAQACITQGLRVGESLLNDLRSDPEVPLLMAHLCALRASSDLLLGRPIQKPLEEGLAWVDRALALDPDGPEAWRARGSLLDVTAREASFKGSMKGVAYAELQVEAGRRAVALRPGDAEGLRELARAYYNLGHAQFQQAVNPLQSHREGRQAALASEQAEPWHPNGPLLALINALDEARYSIGHGLDSAEPLRAGDALIGRLQGMRGLSPRFLLPQIADQRGLQAQVAWNQGQDPDSLQADGMVQCEKVQAMFPEHLGRTTDVGYTAVAWAQTRVASGRSVVEIQARVEPVLAAGLKRWPDQSLLLYYDAWLRGLQLFDRRNGHSTAEDSLKCQEALVAFARAEKAMKQPGVLEILGWIQLAMAEAGVPGSAEKARAAFQGVCDRNPTSRDPRLGLVRALRLRGRAGDRDLAWTQLESLVDKTKENGEVMIHQSVLLADMGKAAESAQLRTRALTLQPLLAGHPLLAAKRL